VVVGTLVQAIVRKISLSNEVGAQKLAGDLGENGAEMLNELHLPMSVGDLDFPEMLEEMTGRAGVASVLRLSPPETVALYSHGRFCIGIHVFFPGECTSVYVTTWVGAGRALNCRAVDHVLHRAWLDWLGWSSVPWYRVSCRKSDFPTESAHRDLLEALVRTGRRC
jgi:hypothetical protein